jgi:hypothetical protein
MTGMDAAYYEDLAGRLYGLVIRLGDRLPAGDARWLHHVTEAGEYGLALEARRRAFLSRWLSSGECAAKFNSPEL